RVQKAVASLGYAPDFGGRVLASGRTNTVGAVIPTMENAIFARGLQAMQDVLGEAGITMLVATSNYDTAQEARQVRALVSRGVDGLLLIGEARDPSVHEMIERRALPAVLVWTWREDCPLPCVGFDNHAAARAMTERVLALGHRQIAMIAGITRDNDRATQRVQGVTAALRSAGLSLSPVTLIESAYSLTAGGDAARQLLGRTPRPTAIICGNDVLAAGAAIAARESGLTVPGALSIAGFDDIDLAEIMVPALTTVRVPHRRMGARAARLILELMNGTAEATRIRYETEIVYRSSLASPKEPTAR
ncbi:MAG: substrate-binding domain-containing protein, partial [Pseudomonadota bacterium]